MKHVNIDGLLREVGADSGADPEPFVSKLLGLLLDEVHNATFTPVSLFFTLPHTKRKITIWLAERSKGFALMEAIVRAREDIKPSFFPLIIEYSGTHERERVLSPERLPQGVSFKVVETNAR